MFLSGMPYQLIDIEAEELEGFYARCLGLCMQDDGSGDNPSCNTWAMVAMGASPVCLLSVDTDLFAAPPLNEDQVYLAHTVNNANCDSNVPEDDNSVSPGESIYICLESTNDQASVASVSDLRLMAGEVEQTVVSTNEETEVVVASMATGSCDAGKCQYEVILDQVMFEAISDALTTTVSVDGTALMELGILNTGGDATPILQLGANRRYLKIGASKEKRSLEEVVGDIRGEFQLVAADAVGGSSAAAAATRLGGGILITTLVVAAAAFDLM
jgi:hypothetical protein